MKLLTKESYYKYIREQIYAYRKDHSLSQERMAEALDISPRSYKKKEHGEQGFSLMVFLAFISLLDEADTFQLIRELHKITELCKKGKM